MSAPSRGTEPMTCSLSSCRRVSSDSPSTSPSTYPLCSPRQGAGMGAGSGSSESFQIGPLRGCIPASGWDMT